MKSRGVAVIAAFVLIALAIIIRGQLTKDDAGGGSDGPKQGHSSTKPVVACTPELAEVCDALAAEGKIAKNPPALDLDDAADPPADIDGWITWNPAPQVANYIHAPQLGTLIWDTKATEPLGSAPLVLLTDPVGAEALDGCKPARSWSCAGHAGTTVPLGVGDPNTAEGLARILPIAVATASDGTADTLDDPVLADIVHLPALGQGDATEMAQQLVTQPGSVNFTTGPEALLKRRAATKAGIQRGAKVVELAPKAMLTVVIAPRTGHGDDLSGLACNDLPDQAADALVAVGVVPCTGQADPALAGFLFQVQKRVG